MFLPMRKYFLLISAVELTTLFEAFVADSEASAVSYMFMLHAILRKVSYFLFGRLKS